MKKILQYLIIVVLLISIVSCNKTPINSLSDPFLTVFLPNILNRADNNHNVFYPTSTKDIWVDELTIYDSWGNQIFLSESFPSNAPEHGWDGTLDGKAVALGTYGYILMMRDGDEPFQFNGDLTIIN